MTKEKIGLEEPIIILKWIKRKYEDHLALELDKHGKVGLIIRDCRKTIRQYEKAIKILGEKQDNDN